jgi:hypothetical protein
MEVKVQLLKNLSLYDAAQSSSNALIYLDNNKKFQSIQSGQEPCQIHSTKSDDYVLSSPVGGIRRFSSMNLTKEQYNLILQNKLDQLSIESLQSNTEKRALG